MKVLKTSRVVQIPQLAEEFKDEDMLATHERYLRSLIKNNLPFLYLGDRVAVRSPVLGKNEGKRGTIIGLNINPYSEINPNHLVYAVQEDCAPGEGLRIFEEPNRALDRLVQAPANALLEKIIRETTHSYFKR